MPTFADVGAILDGALAGFRTKNGRDPDLSVHLDNIGWGTKAELLASAAFGLPLIEPGKIGNGQGAQTNLAMALRTGVPGLPRMPYGGPYLSDDKCDTIIQCIDDNVPD